MSIKVEVKLTFYGVLKSKEVFVHVIRLGGSLFFFLARMLLTKSVCNIEERISQLY